MSLDRLVLNDVRNLQALSIDTRADCVIFTGRNGSGKTSLLEGIYLLGRGASFRSSGLNTVINHNSPELACFGEVTQGEAFTIGLTRNKLKQTTKLRLNGAKPKALSEIVSVFPTLLINPHSFSIVEGGPKERRRLLDWGLFHVEQLYKEYWRKWRKLLTQRNMLLKSGKINKQEFESWDRLYVQYAHKVSQLRQGYFDLLVENFDEIARKKESGIVESFDIREILEQIGFNYYQGWPGHVALDELLKINFGSDQRRGTTSFGPHRADLKIKIGNVQASEILSRGQTKVLVSNLLLAQLKILRKTVDKNCTVLIDDLGAELDRNNQIHLIHSILEEKAQVIVTVLEKSQAKEIYQDLQKNYEVSMFHVEHGQINHAS